MNTEQLLDDIIARLRGKFTSPKLEVVKWPDNPTSKPQFAGGVAALWVGYDGSKSGPPETLGRPIQARARRVSVALFVRQLNGAHGAASYIDATNETLHGWRPSDGGALLLCEDRFGAHTDGVWRYDLVYYTSTPAIPVLDSDSELDGPALRRVTLADTVGGDSEIESTAEEEPDV